MSLPPVRERLCVRCGGTASNWHHRVARGRGGPDDTFNCVPLCGSGTTGCHGFVEANPRLAQQARLDVKGFFLRGRYVGPDDTFRAHYNGGAA